VTRLSCAVLLFALASCASTGACRWNFGNTPVRRTPASPLRFEDAWARATVFARLSERRLSSRMSERFKPAEETYSSAPGNNLPRLAVLCSDAARPARERFASITELEHARFCRSREQQ